MRNDDEAPVMPFVDRLFFFMCLHKESTVGMKLNQQIISVCPMCHYR